VKRLGELFLAHRKRLAPFVILIGLAVVGTTVFEASPRETEIRYDLGSAHDSLLEARIVYLLDGDEVKGARFTWADGAPASIRHTVDLAPGRYEIRVDLVRSDRHHAVHRALRVPADGLVRIGLDDGTVAMGAPSP
jgi:hypothetical protein